MHASLQKAQGDDKEVDEGAVAVLMSRIVVVVVLALDSAPLQLLLRSSSLSISGGRQ